MNEQKATEFVELLEGLAKRVAWASTRSPYDVESHKAIMDHKIKMVEHLTDKDSSEDIFEEAFNKHMLPALQIKREDAKHVDQGSHPKLAEKYANFSKLSKEEKIRMVKGGGI